MAVVGGRPRRQRSPIGNH